MRLTVWHHSRALRVAVERMIAWHPERINIVHGRWYEGNSEAELSMGLTQLMMINELNLRIVERNHALLCL
jgi:hypothetical protein